MQCHDACNQVPGGGRRRMRDEASVQLRTPYGRFGKSISHDSTSCGNKRVGHSWMRRRTPKRFVSVVALLHAESLYCTHTVAVIAAAANGSILSDRDSTTMSFLLRKPRGVPATRVPPPAGHRDVASRGKSSAAMHSSLRSAGGGQQQQLLLQRHPAQQTHKTIQSSKQKTQQVSTETQKELQGVISMEEGTTYSTT